MTINETTLKLRLGELIADCEDWEQNELSSCNDVLYSLLTRCYELYRDVIPI